MMTETTSLKVLTNPLSLITRLCLSVRQFRSLKLFVLLLLHSCRFIKPVSSCNYKQQLEETTSHRFYISGELKQLMGELKVNHDRERPKSNDFEEFDKLTKLHIDLDLGTNATASHTPHSWWKYMISPNGLVERSI